MSSVQFSLGHFFGGRWHILGKDAQKQAFVIAWLTKLTELMAIIGKLNWTDQTELILDLIDLTHSLRQVLYTRALGIFSDNVVTVRSFVTGQSEVV